MGKFALREIGLGGPQPPDEVAFYSSSNHFKGYGSPEGRVPAEVGDSYLDISTGDEWQKTSSNLLKTGWVHEGSSDLPILATGSTTARAAADRFAEVFNVKDYGGIGNGTDETDAVLRAYGALSSTDGGVLHFPPGKWKFNLVITKPNVTISGVSHMHDNSGSGTLNSHFIPAVSGSPVIQVGNDTCYVRGFAMHDVTIDGQNTGSVGVFFSGGAFEAHFFNSAVTRFSTCIKIQGGTAYPASLIFIDKVDGQVANVSGARGYLVTQPANYPTSYTTGIYIDHAHWDGPASNGYMFETDSCEVTIANSYFDLSDNHGFKTTKSLAPNPKFYFSDVTLDSANSSDVLIETHNTSRIFSDIVVGRYSIDGLWKLSDATTLTPPPSAWPQNTALSYPNVTGSLNLVNSGEADYTGGSYTNHRIYAASGNLFVQTLGNLKFQPGGGIAQIDGTAAGGDSYLKLQDNLHSKSVLITGLNGVMYLAPAASGSVNITTAAGVNLMRFLDDGRVFFDKPPRLIPMTKAARNALTGADGMMIYQSDNTPGIRFYENGAWARPTVTADP